MAAELLKFPEELMDAKLTAEKLIWLLESYSNIRNLVSDFDQLVLSIGERYKEQFNTQMLDVHIHFLYNLEIAYAKIYKPNTSIDFLEELKNKYDEIDHQIAVLKDYDLKSNPAIFKIYLDLLKTAKSYLSLAADTQSTIYNKRAMEALLELIHNDGSPELKRKAIDLINKFSK